MFKVKSAWLVLIVVSASLLLSTLPASAAGVELSASIKMSFDKIVAAADSTTAAKLKAAYKELGLLLEQDRTSEVRIKELHYRNEEAILALRKQIRDIDADKLNKLNSQVLAAKERYKPLFASYTAANKQITAAKPLKNKWLNTLLRTQADALKLPVQLARQDIRNKEAALKTAKAATAVKVKSSRESLAAIDPLKIQIKAQRNAASLPRKSLSPVWTDFKYAIKKSEARSTRDSLATLVRLSQQIADQQNKIYALEVRIHEVITKTKARIL